MKKEVLIIGAGLTGLLLAYRLKKEGIAVKVIEARDRIGGRIHTLYSDNKTPIEMGATWLGKKHQELFKLLEELNLPVFEQFMEGITLFEPLSTAPPQQIHLPANEQPSYRIQGGSVALINRLANSLTSEELVIGEKVVRIQYLENHIEVHSSATQYRADKVVSTLPPALLVNSISCTPPLPKEVISIANNTHTWMADSIKFGISYQSPFWREHKFSGTIFSNVGPITELYDHSNDENSKFALKGFLQGGMHIETKENRKLKVMQQLQKLFGAIDMKPLAYEDTVWNAQSYTYQSPERFIFPHQNNGHALYQDSYFDHNFYIAGTETSSQFGGYMEGAVRSAQVVYQKLKNSI